MKVPIHNLYYMLLYAWDMLEEGRVVDVSAEPFESFPDLLARVLRTGTRQLLRRGLDRDYVPEAEATRSPRGKFDLATTFKRNLRLQGRVHCQFDEFRPDVLHNQIIKATLGRLACCDDLDAGLRADAADLYHRLHEVARLSLSGEVFGNVVLHRNNRFYAFLIAVCEVLFRSMLVGPDGGQAKFLDFLQNERRMSQLFERFVRNFYRREQQEFSCSGERVEWKDVEGTPEDVSLLPRMKTDLTLRSSGRTIVLDTKYYATSLQKHWGVESVHSGHLYQMFAYLKNTVPESDSLPEGILLYPAVARDIDIRYRLHGYPVRVVTLGLNVPWPEIRAQLLDLIS